MSSLENTKVRDPFLEMACLDQWLSNICMPSKDNTVLYPADMDVMNCRY